MQPQFVYRVRGARRKRGKISVRATSNPDETAIRLLTGEKKLV